MKFICPVADLSEACQNVQRAVSGKTTIPAVEGILLRAEGETVALTGYDLEVGIQTTIPAQVKDEGTIIINAKVLCDILRKLPGETVEIEADARFLARIRSGESLYQINGMSAEEYPELPSITGGFPLVIGQGILREMIRQTVFAAAAVNDSKPVHTGVKFEIAEKELRLVAIDGFRLAVRREVIDYSGDEIGFVVPGKTLNELVKLFGDEEAEVSIGVGKRHIVFDVGTYHMVSRLLEGEFMNYKAAIPVNHATEAAVDVRSFIAGIERISLIITEKAKSPIRCDVLPEQGRLQISCVTALGTARDSVGADISGDALEVGFNFKFLLEALRACDTDEVRIQYNGAVSPVVILPPEGDRYLFMVLPVRLKADG
ncbi:MAG: DNA polymerase III subunit beta [Oscillospiraceae bacterium]|jgi:DNA polymerase-3 subunit beta|nr:DNA polymerase III subunit beta [Oscillospiraceae bacterium]